MLFSDGIKQEGSTQQSSMIASSSKKIYNSLIIRRTRRTTTKLQGYFFSSGECDKFDVFIRSWPGPNIISKNAFRQRFKELIEQEIGEREDAATINAKNLYKFCVDEGIV